MLHDPGVEPTGKFLSVEADIQLTTTLTISFDRTF